MSFSPNSFDQRYINYVQFTLEEKEKGHVISQCKNDRKFLVFFQEKSRQISDFLRNFSGKNAGVFLSEKDFDTLKSFALSKGGFLTLENRRKIYKILLNCEKKSEKNDYFTTFWINKKRCEVYKINEFIYQNEGNPKDKEVIKADTERSDINNIFPYKKYPYLNKFLKNKLSFGLNTLISLNNSELRYFQGYHDVFTLFFYLFLNSSFHQISLFQRFSEFFLKENLLAHQDTQKGFTFPNCIQFAMGVIKIINKGVYDDLVEFCSCDCVFILPFVVSYFTHNIKDLFLRYRVLDYFMCAHPMAVYITSALICIDGVTKIKYAHNKKKLSQSVKGMFNFLNFLNKNPSNSASAPTIEPLNAADFFVYFQELDVDALNFESLFLETESILSSKKYEILALRREFFGEKFGFEKFYPLMREENFMKEICTGKRSVDFKGGFLAGEMRRKFCGNGWVECGRGKWRKMEESGEV